VGKVVKSTEIGEPSLSSYLPSPHRSDPAFQSSSHFKGSLTPYLPRPKTTQRAKLFKRIGLWSVHHTLSCPTLRPMLYYCKLEVQLHVSEAVPITIEARRSNGKVHFPPSRRIRVYFCVFVLFICLFLCCLLSFILVYIFYLFVSLHPKYLGLFKTQPWVKCIPLIILRPIKIIREPKFPKAKHKKYPADRPRLPRWWRLWWFH
jgi:hypothetical protein